MGFAGILGLTHMLDSRTKRKSWLFLQPMGFRGSLDIPPQILGIGEWKQKPTAPE